MVTLAQEIGVSKAIFESDALTMNQAINSEKKWGQFIILFKAFQSANFQHTWRENNKVAHELV